MNTPRFTSRFFFVSICTLITGAVGVAVIMQFSGNVPASPVYLIPDLDLSEVEPQVILKIRDARKAVQEHPTSSETWCQLAMVLDVHSFSNDAMYCYQRTSELDPSDFRWPYLLALATATNDPQTSLSSLEHAVQLNSDYLPARLHLAKSLVLVNRHQEARGQYQAVLRIDPTSFYAHLGMGQVLMVEGDFKESQEHLSKALEIKPMAREGHSAMARLFARLGEIEASEQETGLARHYSQASPFPDPVKEMVQAQGISARSYNIRGLDLMRHGKHREALEQFRRAAELRSDISSFRTNFASALLVLGRLDEAISNYRQVLRVDPSNTQTRNHLAVALVKKGNLPDADVVLQETLRLFPTDPEAHNNLGILYEKQGKLEKAIKQFKLAIAARPNYALAYRSLGLALAKVDRIDEAVSSLLAAKNANPADILTYRQLSNLLVRRAEFAGAADILRQGLAVASSDANIALELAWLLATCQNPTVRNGAEALRVVQIAITMAPNNPMVLDVLAAALAETGDFETAAHTAERALSYAQAQGAPATLIQLIRSRHSLYLNGMAYRQNNSTGD